VTTPSAGQVFFGGTNNGNSSNGMGQLEINRRYSEKMSDRIYDRGDPNGS